MTTVCFDKRPEDAELSISGSRATAYFRENIREVEQEDGTQWVAEEYALPFGVTTNIRERFEADKEGWRALAMRLDYEQTAKEIRDKRDRLLAETDKEMSIDRIVSDIPIQPGSITAFFPFLKSLVGSLTGEMAKYRQALRDVPQQEGFPYDVTWPHNGNR